MEFHDVVDEGPIDDEDRPRTLPERPPKSLRISMLYTSRPNDPAWRILDTHGP